MTISYNWLSEYLPLVIEPERLSKILTSLGLEVESLEPYEELKGGLKGLLVGEVVACSQHPNADKLKITRVNLGTDQVVQIVCGAPNVAVGQKVVVAPVGSTIYPKNADPVTMKLARIRGEESYGMICAEDEIGLSDNHAGILVLPANIKAGTPAATYFQPYTDWIYEIGLTPNRMDAMSHLGVARDVCAYLTHHDKKDSRVKTPSSNSFRPDNNQLPITVSIENSNACQRYSGVSISGVTVKESPAWLQHKLRAIGLRPINNIVDITNFVLHETGQPLHAFDADAITGHKVIVKNLPAGTPFITLDEKERKLAAEDLMICNTVEPMCIAGVFGGSTSGVKASTKNIFLESAWFNPIDIRKTSFRHGLRTDAAIRFEKNTDISNTVQVLKRAALLIKELAGGSISSDIVDNYPDKREKVQVQLKHHYLKKLSGKKYHQDTVKDILTGLGFEVMKEGMDDIWVAAPYSKPDIHLPADVVEEIMRIDGYDNIEIPSSITITPSVDTEGYRYIYKEKTANYLVGLGFNEIFTNSITNRAFFSEAELTDAVKMLNSLSAELNIMRPSMLETGLQSIAHNLNRRNYNLRFFEYGKTYRHAVPGPYQEREHLSLYITGQTSYDTWKAKGHHTDFYYVKGLMQQLFSSLGYTNISFTRAENAKLDYCVEINVQSMTVARFGAASKKTLALFDIKQPVWFADIFWTDVLSLLAQKETITATELPKQLPVQRDLALVVPKQMAYESLEQTVKKIKINKLQAMQLFDVFESDKLGKDKKSLAISFTFLDDEKTMTDKEIDGMMQKIMNALETELQAEIRK
ncbi:MAG TPA: phenylalanine--tRNA ligase subunit beta [Chitinophagaceae bacterium]|nr:phenylalanine--tRNA ligase subunit beta [Chitinophagaceae bacterium]